MQSYWSALQFAPTNLPVFYRGMPQASHGKIIFPVLHPVCLLIDTSLCFCALFQEVFQQEVVCS